MKWTLNIPWKDSCWSWSSQTLATWCKETTYWKRLSLMLGKIEGKRKSEWQRMRLWGNITNSRDMNLSKPQEIVKDREAWHAALDGTTKSRTQVSDWITAKEELRSHVPCVLSYLSQALIGRREKKINKEKNRGWKLIN